MYFAGYVKNCDGDVVPVIGDKVDGTSELYFRSGCDVAVVYGFDDVPVGQLPNDEIAGQLKELVANELRGNEYCGFIWTEGDKLIAVKDVDYFAADLIPKKTGEAEPVAYEGAVAVADLADNMEDAELFEEIMNMLDSAAV